MGVTREQSGKMFFILLLIILITNTVKSSPSSCTGGECLIISSCPTLLPLVFQAKSGNEEAKKQLLEKQCGFVKTLPKVCCPKVIDDISKDEPRLEEVELPQDCGITRAGSHRVVNGLPSKLHAWPWMAALGYKNSSTGEIVYRCGATLVTARHVVTAAHCIRQDIHTVLLGEHKIGDDNDGAQPEEFLIAKITKHENFKSGSLDDDIAVIELGTEVVFKKGIKPVCLPSKTPELLDSLFVSEGSILTGWGRTGWQGESSDILRQGILSVTSNDECQERYSGFDDVNILPSKLCALDRNGLVGACLGDSGGPLVALKKGSDNKFRYYLLGVVSAGYSKCHEVPGLPDVFTRVTYYDQWIRDTIRIHHELVPVLDTSDHLRFNKWGEHQIKKKED